MVKNKHALQGAMSRVYMGAAALAAGITFLAVGFEPTMAVVIPLLAAVLSTVGGRIGATVVALAGLPSWLISGMVSVVAGSLYVAFWAKASWSGTAWVAEGNTQRYRRMAFHFGWVGGFAAITVIFYKTHTAPLLELVLGTLALYPLAPMLRHASHMTGLEQWFNSDARKRKYEPDEGWVLVAIILSAFITPMAWSDKGVSGLVIFGLIVTGIVLIMTFMGLFELPVPKYKDEGWVWPSDEKTSKADETAENKVSLDK